MKKVDLISIKSNNKSNTKLRVFETFSGIGAQHRALNILKKSLNFNFEIIGTSEWDIDAIISYCRFHYPKYDIDKKRTSVGKINEFFKNINLSKNGKDKLTWENFKKIDDNKKHNLFNAYKKIKNQGDISNIKGKDLYNSIGNIDLITYSFPCQDLSIAGSLHGFNKGMKKDSLTRSSLLWEIERILLDLKDIDKLPKFLLLENVSNIMSEKHNDDFILWKKSLFLLGYKSKTIKFNSKDFNFPQNRNRVFSLAILDSYYNVDDTYEIENFFNSKFQFINNVSNNMDEIQFKKFFQVDFFKDKRIKSTYDFANSLNQIIKENYKNKDYLDEAKECLIKNTTSREKIINDNWILNNYTKHKYSRTVTTKQDRSPNAGVISLENYSQLFKREGYTEYRFLTPRESYLLMGFTEEDFKNIKKYILRKDKMYQQSGNSIVVKVLLPIFFVIFNLYIKGD